MKGLCAVECVRSLSDNNLSSHTRGSLGCFQVTNCTKVIVSSSNVIVLMLAWCDVVLFQSPSGTQIWCYFMMQSDVPITHNMCEVAACESEFSLVVSPYNNTSVFIMNCFTPLLLLCAVIV